MALNRCLALLLTFSALSCYATTAHGQQKLASESTSAAPLGRAKPSEVGLSAEKLARIRPRMEELVEKKAAAGIVTVIARNGKVVHFESVGKMDIGDDKPMRADTIFRIYSMTKPIVSVAALTLVEEGKFGLDDPVSKLLPELKDVKVLKDDELVAPRRPMTVRDLLRHTAGLSYGVFSSTSVDRQYREANVLDRDSTLDDMAAKLGRLPLLHHPGARWHYSVSVDVLGLVVERAGGEKLDKLLEKRIFKPLVMVDTGFHVPPDKLGRFAVNYGLTPEGGWRTIDHPKTSRYNREAKFLSGGGGLVSTASDYLRFAQMLLNEGELDGARVLKAKTVREMTGNQLPEELVPISLGAERPGTGFGLGVSVRTSLSDGEHPGQLGEYGWGGAASTKFWVSPKEKIVTISLTQRMPYSDYVPQVLRPLVYDSIVAE